MAKAGSEEERLLVQLEKIAADADALAVISISDKVFRNVRYNDFTKTFTATEEQYKRAFQLWGEEKWDELYQYFKTNKINL